MNTINTSRRLVVGALAAGLVGMLAWPSPGKAADFSGKTIEFMIPFAEGGGSDTWARFLSPPLGENLPGKPTVVVKNVPGGGSITGANLFQSRARPDGLTVFGTSGSTQFPYLLGDKRVQYEYKDWQIVFASPTGGVFYVSSNLGVKSAKDMMKLKGKQLVYGSQGATSLDLVPLLALEILGLDTKAVFGMKGRGEGRLAFERGEANADYQTTSAYIKNVVPMVLSGQAVPLFSWGVLDDNGDIVRDPTFPKLPSFPEAYEMATGKKPSGPAWEAWKAFFAAGFAAQKMTFLPKGTSPEVVQAWRDAAAKAFSTPGFAEKAEAELGAYKQGVHAGAEKMFKMATEVDPATREWVRNWLTQKYNVKFDS